MFVLKFRLTPNYVMEASYYPIWAVSLQENWMLVLRKGLEFLR